jgi:hypothetical protein
MVQRAMTCLLAGALSLVPILSQGQSSAPHSLDLSKTQRGLESRAAATVSGGQGPRAEVPEKYLGTWVLDVEATNKEVAEHAPARSQAQWLRGVADLLRFEWAIKADTMVNSITTKKRMGRVGTPERAEFRVGLKEEGPEFTILSNVEPSGPGRDIQAFHLQLKDDGSLRVRASTARGWADDDKLMRYFVYRKETGEASVGTGHSTKQAVAYLDALKACAPGEFHFSYAGLGEFRNTVVGKEGERCQVKIVHSNMNLECSFSDETITLLTSAHKYENAKKGVLEGSTGSEESARMNKECRIE